MNIRERTRFPLMTPLDGKPDECLGARISPRRADTVVDCNELKLMVARERIELPTQGFSGRIL
jgi:hypothetical protein